MAPAAKAPALPVIKRRVRAGIPVYVVDGPAPARCALMFRVGRADECLLNGGVTHLVEHLALFPLGDQPYQYNGFVDSHRTVFHAAGRPEECLEFLASVTGALADLPMDRLHHEHRVLDAEAAGHGSGGLFDALVTYRFGPRGLGMLGYAPFGAQTMTASQVDAWRTEWFTAGNAALIVSGVPVESLRLTLPPGERRTPVLTPTVEPELPAWFTSGGGLGLSMVAERGPALAAGLRIVEKRLQRRLRTEMAVVYQVGASTQFLDARTLHLALGCDPSPDHAADALNAIREELDRLAADGPDPDELESDRAGMQREWEDPNAGYAVADLLATDELIGADRRTPAAIARGVRSVTVADVAKAMDAARGTALWAVPEHVTPPSTVRRVSLSTRARVEGRRLPPSRQAAPESRPDSRLVVGDRGLGIDCGAEGGHVHVEYDRCVAVLAWKDGARVFYTEDGFVLPVKPWQWKDGARALAEADARIDPAIVLQMGEGSGPPPPERPAPGRRRRRWTRVAAGLGLGLALMLAVVLPFTGPDLEVGDLRAVPAESVPVDAGGYVRCGGSNLSIVRHGARVPDAGPHTPAIAEACRREATSLLVVGALAGVAVLSGAGWMLRERLGRLIPSGR